MVTRKMLVAIYPMIRDNADFLPVDYDDIVTRNNNLVELNLKNIIAFLGEHGADAETICVVETQCMENRMDVDTEAGTEDKSQKKK